MQHTNSTTVTTSVVYWHVKGTPVESSYHGFGRPVVCEEPTKRRTCAVIWGWLFFLIPFILMILHVWKIGVQESANYKQCKQFCKNGYCRETVPISEINTYYCYCYGGIAGENCTEKVEPCAFGGRLDCYNGGECYIEEGQKIASCRCKYPWYGHMCQFNDHDVVYKCIKNPCVHGLCDYNLSFWGPGGYNCSCFPGFHGRYCHKVDLTCASNPCNDGKCVPDETPDDRGRKYKCECNSEYSSGRNCQYYRSAELANNFCYELNETGTISQFKDLRTDSARWRTASEMSADIKQVACTGLLRMGRGQIDTIGEYFLQLGRWNFQPNDTQMLHDKQAGLIKAAVEFTGTTVDMARAWCFSSKCLTIERFLKDHTVPQPELLKHDYN